MNILLIIFLFFAPISSIQEVEARISPSDLKASFVDINGLWERFFGPKKKNIWQTFETFSLNEDTQKDFRDLHELWEEMFSFWVTQKVVPDPEIPDDFYFDAGTTILSGQNYDEYETQLKASLLLLQDINKQLVTDLKLSCKICKKQRSSTKCDGC